MQARLYKVFQQVGEDLFAQRLNSATSGNISVRTAKGLIISRSGRLKSRLEPDDLIELALEPDAERDKEASVETVIHRTVYRQTDALAVVHAHPRFAIALSFHLGTIVPIDLEGKYHFSQIPVLNPPTVSSTPEAAAAVAESLRFRKACILRGHGAFVKGVGETPEKALIQAYGLMTSLEEACEVLFYERLWEKDESGSL